MQNQRVLLGALVAGCLAFVWTGPSGAATTPASGAPALTPPVIVEPFTLLPCHKSTDIGLEGCEEHQTVAVDKVIDQAESVLFTMLTNEADLYGAQAPVYRRQVQGELISAAATWSQFRLAECRTESEVALGGTDSALIAGSCETRLSQEMLTQLHTFYLALRGHSKKKDPAFPKS